MGTFISLDRFGKFSDCQISDSQVRRNLDVRRFEPGVTALGSNEPKVISI